MTINKLNKIIQNRVVIFQELASLINIQSSNHYKIKMYQMIM